MILKVIKKHLYVKSLMRLSVVLVGLMYTQKLQNLCGRRSLFVILCSTHVEEFDNFTILRIHRQAIG